MEVRSCVFTSGGSSLGASIVRGQEPEFTADCQMQTHEEVSPTAEYKMHQDQDHEGGSSNIVDHNDVS